MGDPLTIGLSVGSTIMQALAQRQAGAAAEVNAKAQQQQLNYQAEQMKVNAGQERAAAQRRALEERRQANLKTSRARALAAAGGGSTLDPSVVDIMGDLAAEGQYNFDAAMYEGEERARDLETGAKLKQYEGRMARTAGKSAKNIANLNAATSIVSGGASLYDKYDGGGGETIYWNDGSTSSYR